MSDQLATKEVPCPCCHGEKELPVYDPGGKNLIGKVLCCHCEGEGTIYAEPERKYGELRHPYTPAIPNPDWPEPEKTDTDIAVKGYTQAYLENAKGEMWTRGLTRGVEIGYEKARAEHQFTQADVDQAYTNGLLKGVQRGWHSRGSHDRYQPTKRKQNGKGPNGTRISPGERAPSLSAAQYKDLCNSYRVQLTDGRVATTSPVTEKRKARHGKSKISRRPSKRISHSKASR